MKKMCRSIVLFSVMCLLTLSLSAQRGQRSRIVTDTIFSQVLNTERAYTVYLPKSFNADKARKYPILYLLHGMTDTNSSWAEKGQMKPVIDRLIDRGEIDELIVVTPDAGGSDVNRQQNGYFDMPGWEYEKFFYTEFLPYIEETYRVIGDKQHRAIAGLSMGGGGSTGYGQRHPDMFCAVYAMSAWLEAGKTDAERASADPNNKVNKLMKAVYENSCIRYVDEADDDRKKQLRSVAWYIDCGDDDFLFDLNIRFYQSMRRAGIPCQLRVKDGGHDWEYWHQALYDCLPFVNRYFNKVR